MTSESKDIRISSVDRHRLESLLSSMSPSDSSTIAALNSELQRATIMDPEAMPPNVVTMNSTVRFVIKPGGMIAELQLVYPKDVPWVLAGGHTISIRVVEIIFQPELYGRYHL